jgi:hypothetical protein
MPKETELSSLRLLFLGDEEDAISILSMLTIEGRYSAALINVACHVYLYRDPLDSLPINSNFWYIFKQYFVP